ncbi:DTW domain-containing protein [Vibrio sp. S4M6]|uniref:tRNA-uridine aminocarboxypropyltransferase n=1 Tax=Vibrio sinus TaxID=2946865 RepID=UPI00202AB390|nr:tRNA-uridine aminocarboxypropyltransferase [Vibrio sinus]MCL9783295.1 DTW domain-containing protein [Vibrio sinus]
MRTHAFHIAYQHRLKMSTKPFKARGAKVNRCTHCQVDKRYCLCEHQPKASNDLSAMIILSENEVLKPSNTGRLIADTIDDCHVYQWSRTEPSQQLLATLNAPKYQPILVFPEEYVEDKARVLSSDYNATNIAEGKQPLLIFLDGSWREARRMFRKSPYLDSLPVLSIRPESISQYMMRSSDNENHLATAEVASLVFEQLGYIKESLLLSGWFQAFRESYMLTKSRYKPDINRPYLQKFLKENRAFGRAESSV